MRRRRSFKKEQFQLFLLIPPALAGGRSVGCQITRRDFGNGTYVAYSYNAQGWLMPVYLFNAQNVELFHVLYTRDAAGRITTYNGSQADQSYDYEYDYAGRLLFAHSMGTTDAAMAYTYDAGGNMRSNSEVGAYTYPVGLAGNHLRL